MLSVIMLHVTAGFVSIGYRHRLSEVLIFVNCASRFAVPLFVVLSAFYLSLNRGNLRPLAFYRRTLGRLALPYLIYTALYGLAAHGAGFGWKQMLLSLLTPSAGYHLWFIKLLLVFYLVHPFLNRWFSDRRRPELWTTQAFLVQLGYLVALEHFRNASGYLACGLDLINKIFPLPGFIGYIMAGYLLARYGERSDRILQKTWLLPAAVGIWLAATAAMWAYWTVPIRGGTLFGGIARPSLAHDTLAPLMSLAALAAMLAAFDRSMNAALRRLFHPFGLHSYGVYLTHVFFLGLAVSALGAGGWLGPEDWTFYLLQFCLAAFLSLQAARWLAKVPWGVGKYLA